MKTIKATDSIKRRIKSGEIHSAYFVDEYKETAKLTCFGKPRKWNRGELIQTWLEDEKEEIIADTFRYFKATGLNRHDPEKRVEYVNVVEITGVGKVR